MNATAFDPACKRCSGRGYLTEDPCPECPAFGGYEETECPACEGSGTLNEGDLLLLPGGLLGRVARLAEGGIVVDRYHVGLRSEGWRLMSGIEGRALPAGDVRAHGYYARAAGRSNESAT